MNRLGRIVLLVEDYEKAWTFYRDAFGFEKTVDMMEGGQRFLHIGLPGQKEIGIWFLQAVSEKEKQHVGNQTSRQPALVLYTDDFDQTCRDAAKAGAELFEEDAETDAHRSIHMKDLYGNIIILVYLKQ
ncbi:VOC family protein [Salibacterium sp. K-3]